LNVLGLTSSRDAVAQPTLGTIYSEGITQNYQEAIKWHRLTAGQGNTDLQQAFLLSREMKLSETSFI
jgi:TPR repeat protein